MFNFWTVKNSYYMKKTEDHFEVLRRINKENNIFEQYYKPLNEQLHTIPLNSGIFKFQLKKLSCEHLNTSDSFVNWIVSPFKATNSSVWINLDAFIIAPPVPSFSLSLTKTILFLTLDS